MGVAFQRVEDLRDEVFRASAMAAMALARARLLAVSVPDVDRETMEKNPFYKNLLDAISDVEARLAEVEGSLGAMMEDLDK